MAEENKTQDEPDVSTLTPSKVHPALKEKLEARQSINRGDVLPNDVIFEERVNFPSGDGGYMAISDSSVMNNGVTPVIRIYSIIRSYKEITSEDYNNAVSIVESQANIEDEVIKKARIRAVLESIALEKIQNVIYVIGDHKEPTAANILEPVTQSNIDTVSLSNAKSYDPNTNIFLKPGVGITKVDLKHVAGTALFVNQLSFTIDILCENIHDYYEFVEPIFCMPGAKFNLDVAWSNVELYSIQKEVNANNGLLDIVNKFYSGTTDSEVPYIVKNRGDIMVLQCSVQTFRSVITKTGGMRVTLTGLCGETKTFVSQPIREEQTNQQSIEQNLENIIWETIQKRISEDYDLESEADNVPITGQATEENLRDEFDQLTQTITFRKLTETEFYQVDKNGNQIAISKYESIIDPVTLEEIYYDPVTGENFIALLINDTTLEEVYFSYIVNIKKESGLSWENFLNVAFPAYKTNPGVPQFDGQDASAAFWDNQANFPKPTIFDTEGEKWVFENIASNFIPEYIVESGRVTYGDTPTDYPLPSTNTIALDAFNLAIEEYEGILKNNRSVTPTQLQQSQYAVAPPPPMTDSYLSRRSRQLPLIVNAGNDDPANRLNLLADFLKQQSGLYMDSISTPNAVASEWGVWIRSLTDEIGIPGIMLDRVVEANNLSLNDFYIQLGWFEDEILNTVYGDPTFAKQRTFKNRKFNSMDQYLRRFSEYELITNDRATAGDAPYLVYPNSYQMSYNAEQGTVPAPYRAENIKKADRIDPITNIATFYEFHTKKNNLIPMREVFLNVGKLLESLSDSKVTLGEALRKVLDDIDKDSEGFYSLEYKTANSQHSYNEFIELNHQPIVPQPKIDGSDDVFYFRPFSPDSLVHDIKMGIRYQGDTTNFLFAGSLTDKARKVTAQGIEKGKNVADLEQIIDLFDNSGAGIGVEYFVNNALSTSDIKTQEQLEKILSFKNSVASKADDRIDPMAVGKAFASTNKLTPFKFGQKQNETKVDYESAAAAVDQVEDSEDRPIGATKTVELEPPTNKPETMSARYERRAKIRDALTVKFLPYFLELDIWGTGMFEFGDFISVDYLPARIKKDFFFIVSGMSHSIDEKGWKTSLEGTLRQRQDKPMPIEVENEKTKDEGKELVIQPEEQPKPPKPKEPKKKTKKKRYNDDLFFDDDSKPVPEVEKLDGVARAVSGIHRGKEFSIFFIDQLLTPSGKIYTKDFNWLLRGVMAYSFGDAPIKEGGYGTPYFPGHISYLSHALSEFGYENGRQLHYNMTVPLRDYFNGKGANDPLIEWFNSNRDDYRVFSDKKLIVKPGNRYIRVDIGAKGTVILKQENPPEPFYDYLLPTPEIPPTWDQELYGPWKDDQLKRLYDSIPDLSDQHPTWYDSNKVDEPDFNVLADDQITGYQVLRYQYTYVTRLQAWSQYVAPPSTSPVKAMTAILQQLDRWDKFWSSADVNSRIDAKRDKQIKDANFTQ